MSAEQLVMGIPVSPRWTNPNPAVQRWGFGPEGKRCGDCEFLFCTGKSGRKRFHKCRKRGEIEGITKGPRTDHRVRWDACTKFKEENGGPPIRANQENQMHYKNGREAKNGDKVMVIPDPKHGGAPRAGILYDAVAGNDHCNDDFDRLINLVGPIQVAAFLEKEQCEREDM